MPDEEDEVPRFVIVRTALSPRRHSSETNAVLNDVVKFAVAEILRSRQPHIRRPGIEFLPHFGISAAVVRVATGAVVSEMPAASDKKIGGGSHGVLRRTGRFRYREPLHRLADESFDRSRRCPGAHSRIREPSKHEREQADDDSDGQHNSQSSTRNPADEQWSTRQRAESLLVVKSISHLDIDLAGIIIVKSAES